MIKIITVGKIKNKELDYLIEYYLKQIPRKVEIVNIKDEAKIEGMEKEANGIIKNINESDFVIVLAIKGKAYTSEEFSKSIEKIENEKQGKIVFIIGGSFGLHESVTNRANLAISFSKMTFPHQLMFLILSEQIFRAYSIMQNHPYHK